MSLISADDHLDLPYVPARLWQERLPARLRDAGPKVVTLDDGFFWSWEGKTSSSYGRKIGLIDSFERAGLPKEPEAGVYRPSSLKYRLQDMDLDGVATQVIYPPFGLEFTDPELGVASIAAFNDWFVQDFAAASPDRLIVLPKLPAYSPEAAVAELERLKRLGVRGVLFDPWGGPKPPFDDIWEPLWSAAEEAGIIMHFHILRGMHSLQIRFGTWQMAAGTSVVHMQMDEILAGMIFSGVLERHPRMQLVLAECGIGWVPYVLDMMDYQQKEWGKLISDRRLPMRASDYFRRQMFVTFEEERIGVRLIPDIGIDNVMWASDYPHGISTFPKSKEVVNAMFAASSPETKRKVTHDTAARLYGLSL